jgi:hypothetical protein
MKSSYYHQHRISRIAVLAGVQGFVLLFLLTCTWIT